MDAGMWARILAGIKPSALTPVRWQTSALESKAAIPRGSLLAATSPLNAAPKGVRTFQTGRPATAQEVDSLWWKRASQAEQQNVFRVVKLQTAQREVFDALMRPPRLRLNGDAVVQSLLTAGPGAVPGEHSPPSIAQALRILQLRSGDKIEIVDPSELRWIIALAASGVHCHIRMSSPDRVDSDISDWTDCAMPVQATAQQQAREVLSRVTVEHLDPFVRRHAPPQGLKAVLASSTFQRFGSVERVQSEIDTIAPRLLPGGSLALVDCLHAANEPMYPLERKPVLPTMQELCGAAQRHGLQLKRAQIVCTPIEQSPATPVTTQLVVPAGTRAQLDPAQVDRAVWETRQLMLSQEKYDAVAAKVEVSGLFVNTER